MARGTGGVYQRGKIWWIRFYVAGHERRESWESEEKDDALRLLKKRLGETASIRETGGQVTFDHLVGILEADYRLNERSSLPHALAALEHMRPVFGGVRADRITSDKLTAYAQARREKGAAPATVKMELALLRRAMRLAARANRLDRIPVFPTIRVDNVRTGFTEQERFDSFCEMLPARAQLFTEFLFLTGWRFQDVANLQWRQIDLKHGSILLEKGTTKNKAGRVLPYRKHPRLTEIIKAQRAATSDVEREHGRIVPWVFHRPRRRRARAGPR